MVASISAVSIVQPAGEAVCRGMVPYQMVVPTRGSIRERIAQACRSFNLRHGCMPTEIEIDGIPYAVAGECDCGRLVLQSDIGANRETPTCNRCVGE